MKPIQAKKIRNNRSVNLIPKQLEPMFQLDVLDLAKSSYHDQQDNLMVTERFHSVPFQLFVQGSVKPMSEFSPVGNMTERFIIRDPMSVGGGKSGVQMNTESRSIFTINEEDEFDNDFEDFQLV